MVQASRPPLSPLPCSGPESGPARSRLSRRVQPAVCRGGGGSASPCLRSVSVLGCVVFPVCNTAPARVFWLPTLPIPLVVTLLRRSINVQSVVLCHSCSFSILLSVCINNGSPVVIPAPPCSSVHTPLDTGHGGQGCGLRGLGPVLAHRPPHPCRTATSPFVSAAFSIRWRERQQVHGLSAGRSS